MNGLVPFFLTVGAFAAVLAVLALWLLRKRTGAVQQLPADGSPDRPPHLEREASIGTSGQLPESGSSEVSQPAFPAKTPELDNLAGAVDESGELSGPVDGADEIATPALGAPAGPEREAISTPAATHEGEDAHATLAEPSDINTMSDACAAGIAASPPAAEHDSATITDSAAADVPARDVEAAMGIESSQGGVDLPSNESVARDPVDAIDLPENERKGATPPPFEPVISPADQEAQPLERKRQTAVHRDRRGERRAQSGGNGSRTELPSGADRPPGEARLRLLLHPVRRTAALSLVLLRPEGFPERVTLALNDPVTNAYDTERYDDVDLQWTDELLASEIRIASAEGFQWLRSQRQLHIFVGDPSGPGLISVGAARAGVSHTLICRSGDVSAIRATAEALGSPELSSHELWRGIPEGWEVLSGYAPRNSAPQALPTGLRPLDPGASIEIALESSCELRARTFAEGHPPRIEIRFLPEHASVTIDGLAATRDATGQFEAVGWDAPGKHLIDVVPGPSLTYEIIGDPASQGWSMWDAQPMRFGGDTASPWARAEICGAAIRGPSGEMVLAAETKPVLVALGARNGIAVLRDRSDLAVSVALVNEPPSFLLSATGQRRNQGEVKWLGHLGVAAGSRSVDSAWATAIRLAAGRRLPLQGADSQGERAWRKAKQRARRLRRPRA